jgi:hypothetical protein
MKSNQKLFSTMVVSALVALFLFSAPTPTRASVITLTPGQSTNLAAVIDNNLSVQIGDKQFADFFFSYLDTDGILANDLTRSNVTLTALGGNFGFGLSFQDPLIAVGPVIKDIVFKYTVLVTDPNFWISDIHLAITGSAGNGGLGTVGENVFNDSFGGTSVGTLQATLPVASGDVAFANIVPPVTKLWVQKDVIVTGNSNPAGFASITIIDQQFSQIPEPSTVLLVGLGLLGVVALKRKL